MIWEIWQRLKITTKYIKISFKVRHSPHFLHMPQAYYSHYDACFSGTVYPLKMEEAPCLYN